MKKRPITVVEMGRLGGLARAAKMTPEQRSAACRRAVIIRWALAKEREKQARGISTGEKS